MADNTNKEPKTFIIQNVTPGYHYITDLKLSIEPLGVVDLTYREAAEVKSSQNLKDSLRAGYVRQIDEKEADRISGLKTAKLRRDVTKLQQQSKLTTMDIDGKPVEVEPINLSRADAGKMTAEVSSAGYANDPLSYVVAFETAQDIAKSQGDILTPEEFAEMVNRDSELVRRLITENTNSMKRIGYTDTDSAAVFAVPPGVGERTTKAQRIRMKAPESMEDPEIGADAEQIDLTKELE